MSMTDLNGKRILLTGGTSGIGSATLTALAAAGARVVTCGRHQASLEEAMAAAPGDVSVVAADLADEKGVDAVFAAVDDTLGGIDMLVACAALGADPIVDMDDTNWRYVLDTNLAAFLGCAKHSIERMEVAGGGHLLFVGSISTEIKAVGESVYAATKAGVQAFAETLRKEVAGRNIKVSVIQPGSVDTAMQQCSTEEKRAAVAVGEMLDPAEIAEAILFVLTRSAACDIVNLRIEPLLQKTA
jgi:3-hydroxy acid dehydrogenase/malonic semialdehyde reductase